MSLSVLPLPASLTLQTFDALAVNQLHFCTVVGLSGRNRREREREREKDSEREKETETDRESGKQRERQRERQKKRQTVCLDGFNGASIQKSHIAPKRQTERQTGRQTEKKTETDKRTDGQTDRDRQTETREHISLIKSKLISVNNSV
ncbi:hypothetical protein ACF0H5_005767 [Mactra antiquata]